MAVAVLSTVLAIQPPFLVGALGVFVRQDLRFDQVGLGAAVAVFFGASSLASVPGGRLSDRLGARSGILLGALGSAGVLLSIGTFVRSWGQLVVFLALAGVANGVAQPAANSALASAVSRERQGAAFGIKQSAQPAATLAAGLAVPAIALTIGWRWAFIAVAATVGLLIILLPVRLAEPRRTHAAEGSRKGGTTWSVPVLALLATGAGFGAASATALTAFFVEASVSAGISAQSGGLLLAGGSLMSILVRLTAGWRADRRGGRHLRVVASMLLAGAVGHAVFAMTAQPVVLLIGIVLAFGGGWGWPGLLNFAVLRRNRDAPATASGIIQAGGNVGGILGPFVFGVVATRAGFSTAWTLGAVSAAAAAALVVVGARLLLPSRAVRTP